MDMEFKWIPAETEVEKHVYMGRAYQALMARHEGSEARLLQCRLHGQTAYLPLLVREVSAGHKEAYSAYGYGGLLGVLTLSEEAIQSLRHFLSLESILAVFVRHSPFLANHQQWPDSLLELNRRTYIADLRGSDSFDSFLKAIPQKLRWSINFARRAGLRVRFQPLSECSPEQIQIFYQLYAALMQQKQTSNYYLFSEELFLEHARLLGTQCELAQIIDPNSGNLIAAAFFLLDASGWAHYHLSAATASAMKLQSMELLLASAIQRYGNMGLHALNLGGGLTLEENDGLSRFKSKFANHRLDFNCTKLVCNEAGYHAERARLPLKQPSLFLISDARGR